MKNGVVRTSFSNNELYTHRYISVHNKRKYVCRIRGEVCPTVNDFFKEISSGMHFWYGFLWTWEDVEQQLKHPREMGHGGYLIIVCNPEMLFRRETDKEKAISDMERVFQNAAHYWEQFEVPFSVWLNSQNMEKERGTDLG